ncbi:DEAD/DEAH box helicase [Ancylostoma duodenale]|uniref:ATP-dependent RNA helicase n=1 Tax=Ancylostoma duodenale TaxID=51022 RepID=A0A0C2DU61_9BILA|nr:DEAD/DEAH box helicase [Ancylostoma duodenale]
MTRIRAGRELLNHHDVVVESPTGSGKTLAYLLPTFAILSKRGAFGKHEFGAVILSPSRELSSQIATVASPFAEKLDYSIAITVGGTKVEQNLKKLKNLGGNILVATPGRLFQLLSLDKDGSLKRALKTVEVLIVDEADRFHEAQFEMHFKEILQALPKQRRNGLFSATQAKEVDDLSMFGLRNKKVIKIKQSANLVSPSTLNNFYTVCEAAEKLMCVVEFVRNKPDKKILILSRVLTKRPLYAVHGHSSSSERSKQIEEFRKSENGVMLSTDVMSRGIDIQDIDWVIQFEIPKLSSWFVHRSGRTARCGRDGNALLVITPQQIAYVGYLTKHEQVELKELSVPTSNASKADQLREKIIKIVCTDREILEAGTRAFVSHIESYVKHDCNIVCGLKDLDVSGLAHAYGLLRLPKMRELSGRKDLDKFQRSDIDTSTIKYANPALERKRSEIMAEKHEKKLKAKKEKLAKKLPNKKGKGGKTSKDEAVTGKDKGTGKESKALKRKIEQNAAEEKDDLENDVKLLKKMKKGRLSKKELRDVL